MTEEELKKLLEEHASSIKTELDKTNELIGEMKKDFEEFRSSTKDEFLSLKNSKKEDEDGDGEEDDANEDDEKKKKENKDLEARNNALNLRANSNLGVSSDTATKVAKSIFGENMTAK